MPDGSVLGLREISETYDPRDRVGALNHVQRAQEQGDVITGLLYVDPIASDIHEVLETPTKPLNQLSEADLCPKSEALTAVNTGFR